MGRLLTFLLIILPSMATAEDLTGLLPIKVGTFPQVVHKAYAVEQGLPSNDVQSVEVDSSGSLFAVTSGGAARLIDGHWEALDAEVPRTDVALTEDETAGLREVAGATVNVRAIARLGGEVAVAADSGLFVGQAGAWRLALPQEGHKRWAPVDVRTVAYDSEERLWFAAPQGVGCRLAADDWHLYTGADGLPYNDFTCMAAGGGSVWFGTSNGAIQFRSGQFSFRQGRRWLLDNEVHDIAVDKDGTAWIATSKGVSCIADQATTLAEKARYFEDEIELYHRRTELGYVDPARLSTPGDKSSATPVYTDNDGHFTGLYLGAVSLGYAATGREWLRGDAQRAFRALSFLSEVTQGGTHPAPEGFIARTVLPTSEPDPNPDFDLAYDQRRHERDKLWKIIQPRWPVDESGEWYWKNDSSSDELDGHFFGYALYFDHVCKSDAEKEAVRIVVRRIIDHILRHGYNMIDYDGQPTRWGHFSPDDLNRNPAWCDERGLNSLSILTYLAIAHHVTGDAKYREVFIDLAMNHGYAMNGMTQPKSITGPGLKGHQPDDNMAFMNYYHLLRYEQDPKLLNMFQYAIYTHWQHEKAERNAFTNFVYAACCLGQTRTDQWGDTNISPPRRCLDDAIGTLKRFPLDLVDWPMSNAHRIDMVPLLDESGEPTGSGMNFSGEAFPIDERHEVYWDLNPWALTSNGEGLRLRDGVPYLLAYYMGLAHGFVADESRSTDSSKKSALLLEKSK